MEESPFLKLLMWALINCHKYMRNKEKKVAKEGSAHD
jgi:hypothetical protein